MLSALILLASQNAEFARQQADEKARAEILDYRGRLEHCEGYPNGGPEEWRCSQLKADAQRLKARFGGRPDLLALMDKDSSQHDKSVIISTGGYRLWSGHVEHVAFDQNDRRYLVTAESDGYALRRVTLRRPDNDQELILIPEERILFPDLQSLRIASATGETVSIEIEYGAPRLWCFANIEAQPNVTFSVKGASVLEAQRQNFEGCRANDYKPLRARVEVHERPSGSPTTTDVKAP